MKTFLVLFFLSLSGFFGKMATAQSPHLPASYPVGTKINYVRSWQATAPETDPNALMSRSVKDVVQTTQYLDGLGRPIQVVVRNGSLPSGGSATDMVTPIEYDAYGREQYKFLSYAATTDNGLFKTNPFADQASFYAAQLNGQSQTYYYGQTKFEASPLNRVQESFSPGDNWVGTSSQVNAANRRSVKTTYFANTSTDDVKVWSVTDVSNSLGTYSTNSGAPYGAGELYKTITEDEQGAQVVEFKDKEGQVILKKVQLTGAADNGSGSGYTGWLCTYYIYDDLNRLRCVIQPAGVELLIANSWNIAALSGDILNEQCFRYEYDSRNRMIRKKVPGAGESWMIYDKWDRLVLTQDANLHATNKWIFTKYDQLNRTIFTGFYINSTYTTPSSMQTYVDGLNMGRYETYNAANWPLYTLTNTFPSASMSDALTISYYDDYSWAAWYSSVYMTKDNSYDSYFHTPGTSYPYAQPLTQSSKTKGLLTGMWQNASAGLLVSNFYDDEGRIIQVKTYNQTGGADIITTQYSFNGQPLMNVQKIDKAGGNAQQTIIVTKMSYDDLWRPIKTEKQIRNTLVAGNALSAYKTISQQEYDALGQLKKKKLAPEHNNNAGLESLAYDYNIRGWLIGLNRDYINNIGTKWFGYELGYDRNQTLVSGFSYHYPQFNGNISGTIWKTKGDSEIRRNDFKYDAVNRLTAAEFTQFTNSAFTTLAGLDFSVSNLSYDANGNIMTMNQQGFKGSNSGPIDQLAYTYETHSNKLAKVTDAALNTNTKLGDFKDGANGSGVDYDYDDNGNLTVDNNKDITNIAYNHLNLPSLITLTNNRSIAYYYDALGTKLKKLVTEPGQTTKTTLYLNGLVFENDVLQFIPQEEGRIRFSPATVADPEAKLSYDYFLKDHLGNVRMVLTEEIDSDPYPTLSFDGSTGEINEQNAIWENQQGLSIDVNASKIARPGNFGTSGDNGNNVMLVRKSTGSFGAGKLLKVMSGDRIHTSVEYYYMAANTNNSGADGISTLIANLASALTNSTAIGDILKPGASTLAANLGLDPDLISKLNSNAATSGGNTAPKAYLHILFFDERFKYDNLASVVVPVAYSPNTKAIIDRKASAAIDAKKNGYVYVYFSNESDELVYFDNLMLTHEKGPLLEETHYYAFGLTMAGISSQALKADYSNNKNKYNGIEKEDALGIEIYDAQLRELDPQIGRWWQVDPKIESMEMWSPYSSNYDNPIRYSDPLGDEGQECCGVLNDALDWASEKLNDLGNSKPVRWINNNINPLTHVVELVTGKSNESDFTEDKPRMESTAQLGLFLIPTAKAEAVIANEVKNVVVGQVEKQVVKKIDREALKRGVKNEGKALADEGLPKNTKAVTAVDSKTGKTATTIPDSNMPTGATVEVKDVKKLSDSRQLRTQSAVSAKSGQKGTVITGTKTKVSSTVEKRMRIIRKDYLGPQK